MQIEPRTDALPGRSGADPIVAVRSSILSVPLPRPIAWSNVRISHREYVLVTVEGESGHVGTGFTLGSRFENGARIIKGAVDDVLAPVLLGEDAAAIGRLWEEMSFRSLLLGRRGAVVRAISAIDIALWDLLARSVGRPLCDLLGRHRLRVPAYASGGYYYDEDFERDTARLVEEVGRHVELGFRGVKIKIGRLAPHRDRERIVRVLEAVGEGVRVAVDANHAWRDPASAINDLRHVDDLGLWWIEEPVLPDQVEASARIAEKLTTPIATGEVEAGRAAFEALVERKAASILQPDVTVVGGVSEWMKIAGLAACRDVALAPHWVPDVHIHLAAACPSVLVLEYFHESVGVLNFEALLAEPLRFEDGDLLVAQRPGHGILFDLEAIAHYTVA